MKRILVVSFEDLDVSEGLAELIHDNPGAPVVIPVTDDLTFVKSAVDIAMKHDCTIQLFFSQANEFTDSLLLSAEDLTVCDNPIKTMLREVTPEDIWRSRGMTVLRLIKPCTQSKTTDLRLGISPTG